MRIGLCLASAILLSVTSGCGGSELDCAERGDCVEQVQQDIEVDPAANHGGGCKGGGSSGSLKQLIPQIEFEVDGEENTVELEMVKKLCMGFPGLSTLCNQPGTFTTTTPTPPTTGPTTDPVETDPSTDPGTTADGD